MRVITLIYLMLLFVLSCLLPGHAEGTEYSRMLQQIVQPDRAMFEEYYEALRWDTDPGAEAALRGGLRDTSPVVRALCIRLLLERRVRDRLTLAQIALQDNAPEARYEAFLALMQHPDPAAFDWLVPLLRDPQKDIRRGAAQTLGFYGHAAEAPLLAALHDDSGDVRVAVVGALAKCGGVAASAALITLLKTETDKKVRGSAMSALCHCGGAEGLAVVTELLKTETDNSVLMRVFDALGRIGSPAVETLSRFAVDPNAKIRQQAVYMLRQIDDPRIRPLLEAALRDPDREVRYCALPDPARDLEYALPLLHAALRDPDVEVRGAALGKLAWSIYLDERSIPLLLPLLNDAEARIQSDAARCLSQFPSPQVTEALLDRMQRSGCPDEVFEALGKRREARAVPALIARLSAPIQEDEDSDNIYENVAYHELAAIGESAVAPLVQAAASTDLRTRQGALEALGAFDDPRALKTLLAAAVDKEKDIRIAAFSSLGDIGDARGYAVLISALDDPDEEVRAAAASALEGCQDTRIIAPLARLLRSRDEWTRDTAACTLAEMDDPRVVPLLCKALQDSEDFRNQVHWSDGAWIRDPRAIETLIRLAMSGGDSQDNDALDALKYLPTDLAVQAITQVMRSGKAEVREAAVDALGEEHHDPRASKALVPMLTDADVRVRRSAEWWLGEWCAPEAFPALRALLGQTGQPEARLAAIRVLAKQGDAETLRTVPIDSVSHRPTLLCMVAVTKDAQALPLLLEALRDPNPSMREVAAEALGTLGDARAVDGLLLALRDEKSDTRYYASLALGKIKAPASVEPLIALLGDKRTREDSARALGEIGDKRAIEPLLAMLPKNLNQAANDFIGFGHLVEALCQLDGLQMADRLPALLEDWRVYHVDNSNGNLSAVWEVCLRSLGELRDPRAIEICTEALRDDADNQTAIDALVAIGGDRAVDVLLSVVNTPETTETWEREEIVDALAAITAEHLQEKLTAAAASPRWRVRLVAVTVLARRSEAWAGPLLAAAVHDPQPQVSRAAREAGRL